MENYLIYSISTAANFSIEGSTRPRSELSPARPISMELLGTRLSNMKSLDGAKNTAPLKMEGTNPKVAMPMAQSSRTCVQKADSIGLRVVGCLVGAGRAVGLFF